MRFPEHKCGLFLTHNEHKDYYEPLAKMADDRKWSDENWVSPEQKAKAFETDEYWELQWYPDTPVGCYIIRAADLDAMQEWLDREFPA